MTALTTYPFPALVGQETMQLALLLNAVNPAIGGVLIRGDKGTAKSTAARGVAKLLPPLKARELDVELRTNNQLEYVFVPLAAGVPFIELPLGINLERLTGRLIPASQAGQNRFEMGLLAKAHQGILYVDDVNLLADPIVNSLLDVVASGINTVERDNTSATHSTRFILIGTMNPQEGELRPQFLDRFGLMVTVTGQTEPAVRAEIVRRRVAYESQPAEFREQYAEAERRLSQRIEAARVVLPTIELGQNMLDLITQLCLTCQVEGLRADITMYKTAQTLAAWENRPYVTTDDVRRAAQLVLPHRCRAVEEQTNLDQLIDQTINENLPMSL